VSRWLVLALGLVSCHGDDAYLGSQQTPYECAPAHCWREEGAPLDSGDWFYNPEAELGEAPEIVYPLGGSVHPKDLRQLTVQFRLGRADFEVYRIRFAAPELGLAYDFFTPCLALADDGCRYLLKGNVWDNAREELAGKTAILTVTGSTGKTGVIKASEALELRVTPSRLENKGFYYWTTETVYSPGGSEQQTGIYRLPFGADRAEPFIMPNTTTNERQCGACHSVSRDGSTIAFTAVTGSPDQREGVLVATGTARPDIEIVEPADDVSYDSSMMTLSSDGKRVLVAYDDRLVLRNASVDPNFGPGEVIATLLKEDLLGKSPYFPEFSFDDSAVVLTLSDKPDSAIAVQSGDIAVIDADVASGAFEAPRIIVAGSDSEFHFYPTWSPTAEYVAFASAPREIAEDGFARKSYDQKKARLRLVRVDSGELYELTRATHAANSWSTFPKFAPFQDGDLMYLTFNSKIDYGLVVDNTSRRDRDKAAQLWMSAIDVGQLPEDPSSAPMWLPFQDATQSSHLGIWTNDVKCRLDVSGNGCPPGQECDMETQTCRVRVK
jgi:hypothetical protein